jgi:putative inorganic carbon (HCO3(-)) transporter
MGLAVVLAYLALNLLSPAEMFPALAPFRISLILGLASLPLAVVTRLQSPEIGKLRTQFLLVILFFAWASCSWLPHGWIGGNLATILEISPNIIMFFVGVVFFRSPFRLGLIRGTMVLVAIYVIAASLSELSYARASGESTPYVMAGQSQDPGGEIAGANEVRIRGLGMLNDPNIFGQYLLLILPLLFVSTKKNGLGPGYFVVIPLAILFAIGIYLTGSRGAETGLAVLIGLFLIRRFKKAGAVISVVFGSLTLLAINAFRSRTVSLSGGMDRLAIWSEGMQYVKSSPIWGIGIRSFADREGMTAHNSYLLCAAELGMIGFFFWMAIIVVTIIQLNRVPKVVGKVNPPLARWAIALKLSLGGYLFTSFFLSCTYNLLLFLLLGMSGAVITAAGGDDAIPLRGTKWQAWSAAFCGGILALIYVMLRLRIA